VHYLYDVQAISSDVLQWSAMQDETLDPKNQRVSKPGYKAMLYPQYVDIFVAGWRL